MAKAVLKVPRVFAILMSALALLDACARFTEGIVVIAGSCHLLMLELEGWEI